MKNINILVRKFRKKGNDPKAEVKMVQRFNKLSQDLLRELHWKALGYRKPSELRKLEKLKRLKKIKKFMEEQEV